MKITVALILTLVAASLAQQTIYNTEDMQSGSSPGGTSCGHLSQYNLIGQSRGPLLVGFPISGIQGSVSSCFFYLKPARCAYTERIRFFVRTLNSSTDTFDEVNGINNQCPFLTTKDNFEFSIDGNCSMQGVDVTASLNDAIAAGNSQFTLSLFDQTNSDLPEPNFCNPFLNPNVTDGYNSNSNCGALANSREFNPSSFYIVISGASTTAAPTTAEPTTAAPTTAAPTTSEPTTAAPTTAAPTTAEPTTAAPTTAAPTTSAPTTAAPITAEPTTAAPTTAAPTTAEPTTAAPTTAAPTTAAPTTSAPSTAAPTTAAPTTAAPTTTTTTAAPTTTTTVAPTRNCWTCLPNYIHWYDAGSGVSSPPGGDQCACVPVKVSASCSGNNVSGPNVASPGRKIRQNAVCSGRGYCAGSACVCIAGWQGSECEQKTPSKTCAADVSGPNVASPGRKIRQGVCNGRGTCTNGVCSCQDGWIGSDCEQQVSPSCSGNNVSGPNVASPARFLRTLTRQSQACSGNGYCIGQVCICNAGWSGLDCQNQAATTTTQAATTTQKPGENISGDNNAKAASGAEHVVSFVGILVAVIVAIAL